MIVVDANVVLSALRSSGGASHRIVRGLVSGTIPFAVSPAVALEYEDVVKRPGLLGETPTLSHAQIDIVLDAMFARALLVSPWFRFRPFLEDPGDDIYIECAPSVGATLIVSGDRHFRHPATAAFGMSVMSARDYVVEVLNRSEPP